MHNDKTYFYWLKGLRERMLKNEPQPEDHILDYMGGEPQRLTDAEKLALVAALVRGVLFAEADSMAERQALHQLGYVMAEVVDADIEVAAARGLLQFSLPRASLRTRWRLAMQLLLRGVITYPLRKTT